MSKYLKTKCWLCWAGLGLLTAAGDVRADGIPAQVNAGFHFNYNSAGCCATLGPWYSYFPYEAHFQMPAPVGLYPQWPAQFPPPMNQPAQPAPGSPIPGTPPLRTAPPNPISFQQPALQPVGYYGYGYWAPGYWYGR